MSRYTSDGTLTSKWNKLRTINVTDEMLGHGFELEGRAFRPHLTLARVKERTDVEELRRLSRASKKVDFEGESAVRSIDLMKSKPGAAPPRYECLHAAQLRPN